MNKARQPKNHPARDLKIVSMQTRTLSTTSLSPLLQPILDGIHRSAAQVGLGRMDMLTVQRTMRKNRRSASTISPPRRGNSILSPLQSCRLLLWRNQLPPTLPPCDVSRSLPHSYSAFPGRNLFRVSFYVFLANGLLLLLLLLRKPIASARNLESWP